MELLEIEKEFLEPQITPSRVADLRVILSGKYAYAMNKLEEILMAKPLIWTEMRPNFKSDTACERAWEASEMGKQELHWKFQVKKIEKMLSAGKSLIEVKTAEAYSIM